MVKVKLDCETFEQGVGKSDMTDEIKDIKVLVSTCSSKRHESQQNQMLGMSKKKLK